MSRSRIAAVASFAAIAAAGLSPGCGSSLHGYLQDSEGAGYATACAKRADKHFADVSSGNYFLPEFHVHTWSGEMPQGRKIDEKILVDDLVAGKVRFGLINARAGLGKTRLAHSVQAQTCKSMPVFVVDLARSVVPGLGKSTNPLLAHLRVLMGQPTGPEGEAKTRELLSSQRWILLADALEEVNLNVRDKVVKSVIDLRGTFPKMSQIVILARPSVLTVDYGLSGFDTRLHILPIDSKRADKFFAKLVGDPARTTRLKAFLHNNGFDAKASFGFQQIYPLMATYRDVVVLKKLAQEASGGAGVASYAAAHEHLVAKRLAKELGQVGWGPREVLDMVDRMVHVHREKEGAGAPFFTIAACTRSIDPEHGWMAVDTGVAGNSEQRRRQLCERALQSVLFQPSNELRGAKGVWHFGSGTMADLFNARWVNSRLARLPDGQCSTVEDSRNLFLSGSTVRFLVGQPLVQRCMGPAMRILCDGPGAKRARHIERVVEGLPASRRLEVVALIRDYESGKGNNACVLASVDAISGAPQRP